MNGCTYSPTAIIIKRPTIITIIINSISYAPPIVYNIGDELCEGELWGASFLQISLNFNMIEIGSHNTPREFARRAQSFDAYKDFKATECSQFLQFYWLCTVIVEALSRSLQSFYDCMTYGNSNSFVSVYQHKEIGLNMLIMLDSYL